MMCEEKVRIFDGYVDDVPAERKSVSVHACQLPRLCLF